MELVRVDNKNENANFILWNFGKDYFTEEHEKSDPPPHFNLDKFLQPMLKRQGEPERWLFY